MAGPGDEIAARAEDRGHLRASHADREQIIGALQVAFVQGRLDKDEFDLRVGRAFESRTYAELAGITADLPAGLAVARAQTPQPRGWLTMERALSWSACMVISTGLATVISWIIGSRLDEGAPIILSILAFFVATVASGTMISVAWDNRCSRAQLPQGPASGVRAQAALGTGFADTVQIPPADSSQQGVAQAVQKSLPWFRLTDARRPRRWRPGAPRWSIGSACQ
jgi:hypothetical protein